MRGPLPGGDERETRRRHQALLRARDRHVDVPGVHFEGHTGERRDRVDHDERRMPRLGDGLPDGRNVVDDPGRGVDLDREDRLDPACPVGAEAVPQCVGIDRTARGGGEQLHLEAEDLGHLGPGPAEHPALQGQHPIAAAQAIDERCLPGAMAVCGVQKGLASGSDNFLQIGYAAHCYLDNLTRIEIDRGAMHRGQHLVGNGRRTRDGKEFTAAADSHGMRSPDGGEGGIRTPGPSPVNGFQDRRFQPLSHLSPGGEHSRTAGGNEGRRQLKRRRTGSMSLPGSRGL